MSDAEREYGSIERSPNGQLAYLSGVQAAVIIDDSTKILAPTDADPKEIVIKGKEDMPKVVPWGEDNNFPKLLIDKVGKSPIMSANLLFNVSASYGEGVMPVVAIPKGKEREMVPLFNAEIYLAELIDEASEHAKPIYQGILDDITKTKEQVEKFWEENDIDGYILESFTDMHWFFNIFPEITLNKDGGKDWRIVRLRNKEAAFSRYSEMNDNGDIEYHYYYGKWGETPPDEDNNIAHATPVLDFHSPVHDLRSRMNGELKKKRKDKTFRYICPVRFPSPGRNYYQLIYWFSLIKSGWFDFAISIPELKKAIIKNQAIIKYIIKLDKNYFKDIFHNENITDEKKKEARITLEYQNINKFLTDMENNGKSIVTETERSLDGKSSYDKMEITALENNMKGGEYIEDSAEVSSIMCYAMLVNPSMIGPQPGKNSNLSGSEAREQFLIKQAILKPIVNRALRPFYVIKAINNWSKHLHFIIPNIELTTLDENKTGIQTNIDKS